MVSMRLSRISIVSFCTALLTLSKSVRTESGRGLAFFAVHCAASATAGSAAAIKTTMRPGSCIVGKTSDRGQQVVEWRGRSTHCVLPTSRVKRGSAWQALHCCLVVDIGPCHVVLCQPRLSQSFPGALARDILIYIPPGFRMDRRQ